MVERKPESIVVDQVGVTRTLENGSVEAVKWAAIVEVRVVTNCWGPFVEDVFFELVGEDDSGCLIPQASPAFDELMRRFEQWKGFDWVPFGAAMSCTDDARFVCWRRASAL